MPKVLILAVVLAVGAFAFLSGKKAPSADTDETADDSGVIADTKTPSVAVAEVSIVSATYKDGVYSAIGDYVSPAGPETIDVTLTVAGGVVTDATVDANATNPASVQWQGKFIADYKVQVIGKKLADLSLTNVSGSSLTPKGFNEAVAEIRAEAKA